jgi:hypothetical protein
MRLKNFWLDAILQHEITRHWLSDVEGLAEREGFAF